MHALNESDKIIGCPTLLRCDYGTENSSLAKGHIAMRLQHDDTLSGEKSFIYGPSTANIVSRACVHIHACLHRCESLICSLIIT